MSHLLERRLEEKEQRRNEIIDAAEVVFARKGYEQATMEDIARAARLSRPLLYVYFKDKEDLHLAILHRGLLILRRSFEKAIARHARGLDQVEAVGRAYIRFSQTHPDYFETLARFEARAINMDVSNPNKAACLMEGRSVHQVVASAIQQGIDDGSIRPNIGDPFMTSQVLWGTLHGLIQIASRKEPLLQQLYGFSADDLLEHGMWLIRGGLAAPAT
jgi:AcrR family transcriptional regulator